MVSVDGRRLGQSPQTAEALVAGSYAVRVEKPGYHAFERQVRVRADRVNTLHAELAPLPPRVTIDSDIPGAAVFVDREFLGNTPLETTQIEPGPHHLAVSAEGYEMYTETIEVTSPSTRIVVRLDVVRLDESVAVVHKHAFGSCRGRLSATLEGLRYETTHKNHGFAVPLEVIETIEIDYLDKNLRLKIRGGKKYNFAEASGNADALFVFHRSVEKARKR
jgi:hypothetical protein